MDHGASWRRACWSQWPHLPLMSATCQPLWTIAEDKHHGLTSPLTESHHTATQWDRCLCLERWCFESFGRKSMGSWGSLVWGSFSLFKRGSFFFFLPGWIFVFEEGNCGYQWTRWSQEPRPHYPSSRGGSQWCMAWMTRRRSVLDLKCSFHLLLVFIFVHRIMKKFKIILFFADHCAIDITFINFLILIVQLCFYITLQNHIF